MLQNLTSKFDTALKRLRGKVTLTEKDVDDALKEVRLALLEADVNFKVVKEFCAAVANKALTLNLSKSLNPDQMVIKLVHEELINLMGVGAAPLNLRVAPPAIIVLAGLNGAGKTTTASKLALYLRKELKRSPLLVPVDVYRPAAIEQLKTLGRSIQVPVFDSNIGTNPVELAAQGVEYAKAHAHDTVIIDTAGRLQIDAALMEELKQIVARVSPHEILLVADAMTGQEAVNVAKGFNEAVELTGLVLTKLDGDARGGAALSMRAVTGKPIKFIGVSEKPDGLEPFHPERLASRILGMGDVLSLIEKATKEVDLEDAMKMQKKFQKNEFSLEDFLGQMRMVKKMGSISSLASMIPGMGQMMEKIDPEAAEKEMKRIEAIILSMTAKERKDHTLLNGSRRKRIAAGSGTTVEDVNKLIKQFTDMKTMMQKLMKGGMSGLMQMMGGAAGKGLGGLGGLLRR